MQTDVMIGARIVQFHTAKELASQAKWLANLLKEIAGERGDAYFSPGKTIQLGWSKLTLVERGAVLQVHEPDFDGDVFHDTRNDLTATLSVIAQQNDITNGLGIEPVAVDYVDKIVVVAGALAAEKVFFQRGATKPGDSGWTMKLLEDPHRDKDYEWIYVYGLLRVRPEALKILTLPVGYMAFFPGHELDAILDENDKAVYTRK